MTYAENAGSPARFRENGRPEFSAAAKRGILRDGACSGFQSVVIRGCRNGKQKFAERGSRTDETVRTGEIFRGSA